MRFTKAHGLGNDFIILDNRDDSLTDLPSLAQKLCHRQTGVGGDGILVVEPSQKAQIRMRIVNSDGSEAGMCGNGIRCFAKYCYERGLINELDFSIETLAGVMRPSLVLDSHERVCGVRVDMGKPGLMREDIPMEGMGQCLREQIFVQGEPVEVSSLLMGVPHTMVFVEDALDPKWMCLGEKIERHPSWPKHTNVNFVQVVDHNTLRVRTYERGCGPTLACGTGSCASAVAAFLNGITGRCVTVQLALGELQIEYDPDGRVYMTGPAELVFDGELCL